jgi:anthranilate synthase/aminodeoxychorismate synthase-like glutamine amidotransferase
MTPEPTKKRLQVLFIDNFDSFVFNLVDEYRRLGCAVQIWRNDIQVEQALAIADRLSRPSLVVISPGPGGPKDAGCCLDLLRAAPADLPIFGVCLGLQTMLEAFGGRVDRAPEAVHGKASQITHTGQGLFAGLPSPLAAARYHSLVGVQVPDEFQVTASLDGMPMAIAHTQRPIAGVQFHPESILTPWGSALIKNTIAWASQAGS